MIRAREAFFFKKNDGLITPNTRILKCILVSMKIVFFMGVSLVRTPILGYKVLWPWHFTQYL